MTETEWVHAIEWHWMLQHIDGKTTDRKLRLFACACCRRIWDLIEGDLQRKAVELAERFADGAGRAVEWEKGEGDGTFLRFRKLIREPGEGEGSAERDDLLRELEEERHGLTEDERARRYDQISPEAAAEWTLELRCDMPWAVADIASRSRAAPISYWKQPLSTPVSQGHDAGSFDRARRAEVLAQTIILRDILGNPFRPATIEQAWLTPDVVALGQAIYEGRAFDRMPSLGLALQEAGCDNADILAHCHAQNEHARGCWLVDAVLGKS